MNARPSIVSVVVHLPNVPSNNNNDNNNNSSSPIAGQENRRFTLIPFKSSSGLPMSKLKAPIVPIYEWSLYLSSLI